MEVSDLAVRLLDEQEKESFLAGSGTDVYKRQFGVMLDKQPELLFTLRGMDASVLIPKAPEPVPGGEYALDVDAGSLSDIFLSLIHIYHSPPPRVFEVRLPLYDL